MEGELDKMVGLFQKRYGYTREHALETLTHYVDGYRQRAKVLMSEGLEFVPAACQREGFTNRSRPTFDQSGSACLPCLGSHSRGFGSFDDATTKINQVR